MQTVAEAKLHILAHRNDADGVECPACERVIRVYHRHITSAMAKALALIYVAQMDTPAGEPLHIPSILEKSTLCGDASKLRFWGFLEPVEMARPDGSKRAGYYRLTGKGMDFVEGRVRVPKYAKTCDGEFLGLDDSEGTVSFEETCDAHFSFADLMAGPTRKAA